MELSGWLPLAALGIIWAAYLLPRRRASPEVSIQDFGRTMRLLASTEGSGRRYVVAPAKGARFLGPRGRARARARQRRRRVFVFLLESIGLSFLIGLAPPLRAVWYASGVIAAILFAYVWLLLWMKGQDPGARIRERAAAARAPARPTALARAQRYVAGGMGRLPRPAWGGLGSAAEDDLVHVTVRRASAGG